MTPHKPRTYQSGTWTCANGAWVVGLRDLVQNGELVSPRGQPTRELAHLTYEVPMTNPVITISERKLNYRFMAAEAYWMLSGDDRVSTIAPYNSRISQFSDDGERFFGAYGPKIQSQLAYVVQKLMEDPVSRQAGLTLWRENPPATKDVPCTIAMFFTIRPSTEGWFDQLHLSVFMRSSDVWLGIPYDVFNFSMLGHLVAGYVNQRRRGLEKSLDATAEFRHVRPGKLILTAASAHIYERDLEPALTVINTHNALNWEIPHTTPDRLWRSPTALRDHLKDLRDSKPNSELRWWREQA